MAISSALFYLRHRISSDCGRIFDPVRLWIDMTSVIVQQHRLNLKLWFDYNHISGYNSKKRFYLILQIRTVSTILKVFFCIFLIRGFQKYERNQIPTNSQGKKLQPEGQNRLPYFLVAKNLSRDFDFLLIFETLASTHSENLWQDFLW